jgi:tetratricopeptide (TPR) repeat protein
VECTGREPEVVAAIEEARAKVRQRPQSGLAWGRLGMVLYAHHFEAEAHVCLAQAARRDPQDPRWPYIEGLLVERHDPEAALPLLCGAADLAGKISAPRLHLAETLFDLDHSDEAAAAFRRVLQDEPDNPRAHLGLGRLAYRQGDLDASLDHLRRVVAVAPGLRSAHALLAEVYHRQGDTQNEGRELDSLADSDDPSWDDPYLAEVLQLQAGSDAQVRRARSLLAAGRRQEAVAVLQAAARDHPQAYPPRLVLGGVLAEQGNLTEAEPQLRAALEIRPDSAEALMELGRLLQRRAKYREAAECYGHVLAGQPDHALAHFNLAECREQLGDPAGAIESLRAALRCKPEFAPAHQTLGRLLADRGRDAEAVEHLEDALRLAPDDTRTKELLERVRARQPRPGPEGER